MNTAPSPDDIAKWDRWFAIEMNNRAWTIAENAGRTSDEEEEMLHAAHTAALHWGRIGTALQKARADLLLGQVHALLGHGDLALTYARRSFADLTSHESPNWEVAFAHAVLARAAWAAGDWPLHARHHAEAAKLGRAIAGKEDRAIFERTFVQLPAPAGSPTA
jgi:hypothetical protein